MEAVHQDLILMLMHWVVFVTQQLLEHQIQQLHQQPQLVVVLPQLLQVLLLQTLQSLHQHIFINVQMVVVQMDGIVPQIQFIMILLPVRKVQHHHHRRSQV